MANIKSKVLDPQFETTMQPLGIMKFGRQCFIFQLIGMAMFGIRSLDVIFLNKRNMKEVEPKK